jgi:serine/threonine-protein kinase
VANAPFPDEPDSTVVRDPMIGAQLGEYTVLSVLGQGGMGVVYRGEQPVIGKPVAIKVLQRTLSADPAYVKKLLEEARAISAARHPNIIDIFSFGEAPTGQQYFVMECLDGDPLDLHLAQQRKLSVNEVLELLQQVMSGLSAAHAAGVVHRDLKPSNIFLARLGDGRRFVKLLDFGLAKRTAPNSGVRPTANVIVGTAHYMAPEQIRQQDIGPWTDLYAVGCIAHELLTGQVPFDAPSVIEVLGLQASTAPTPLRVLEPGVPEALEALVLELLEKEPQKRPKSAAVVRKILERIERQLGTNLTRPTGLKKLTEEIGPTRISVPALRADATGPRPELAEADAPTGIDLPRAGPVPRPVSADAETQPAKTSLNPRQGARGWIAMVVAPLLGVAGFYVAKALDAPAPQTPLPAATVPTAVQLPPPPPLAVAPPEPVAPPAAVEAPSPPPPAVAPAIVKHAQAVKTAHSRGDVKKKIFGLRSQADAVLPPLPKRTANSDLDEVTRALENKELGLDQAWDELDVIHKKYFPAK